MSLYQALSVIDVVYGEVRQGMGEDCFTRRTIDDATRYFGVFDGCGGLGAKRYENVSNHTGAWIASRVAAAAVDLFAEKEKFRFDENTGLYLQMKIEEVLKGVKERYTSNTGVQVGGSLSKSMPTTVCVAAAEVRNSKLLCDFFWAGDSRAYTLDQYGLCQITRDDIDTNADDAFENLREDGRLTNVANADSRFTLHRRTIEMDMPKLVICSTDGGFAYFNSPMEFEYVLLDTMQSSRTPEEWSKQLDNVLHLVAGDDYTVIIEAFGFSDFNMMKSYFYNRLKGLKSRYIIDSNDPSEEELRRLWQAYKPSYYNRYN
ncbi:MAG: hypothetical protein ACI4JD_06755 [Ruminococcus sp.]